jgi:ABC-type transporter Mla MlaB component
MLEWDLDRDEEPVVEFTLRGGLSDDPGTRALTTELEGHWLRDGIQEARLDLSAVTSLTLEGVATLLEFHRVAERNGKRLTIVNAGPPVRSKLRMTGVEHILLPDAD